MKNTIRSEITSKRIKQAAAALFAMQGYNAAGVAEICSAAEVSKGAFYHHFKSKNQLFISLLEDWLVELDQGLENIASDKTPFPKKLETMGEMIASISDEYQDQIPILFEFWMQASRDEDIWRTAVSPFQKYQSFFAGLIELGIQEGHLKPVDPQIAAQALISLAAGLLLQRMLVSRSVRKPAAELRSPQLEPEATTEWGKTIQASIQIFIDGMRRYA